MTQNDILTVVGEDELITSPAVQEFLGIPGQELGGSLLRGLPEGAKVEIDFDPVQHPFDMSVRVVLNNYSPDHYNYNEEHIPSTGFVFGFNLSNRGRSLSVCGGIAYVGSLARGQGLSAIFNRNCYVLFKKINVRDIDIPAATDGVRVWAKQGFVLANCEEEEIWEALSRRYNMVAEHRGPASLKTVENFKRIMDCGRRGDNVYTIWDMADLDDPYLGSTFSKVVMTTEFFKHVPIPESDMPEMVRSPYWEGMFDLEDPRQYGRFQRYFAQKQDKMGASVAPPAPTR